MPAYKDTNGTWYVKFYFKQNGKSKQKKKRGFRTKREALSFEREFLLINDNSVSQPFSSFCDTYINDCKAEWKICTVVTATSNIRVHLKPYFGDTPLDKITPLDVKKFQTYLMQRLSPQTVVQIIARLSAVFNHAVKFYGLASNPCNRIKRPKVPRKESKYITVEDFEEVIKYVPERYNLFVRILFWTGLRISEVLPLTIGDIHNGYISVNKNKVRHTVIQDTIKNNHNRRVHIHQKLQTKIANYISTLYDESPDTPLFTFSYESSSKVIKDVFTAHGHPYITAHKLRHSHAALLIHMGYSIKQIADRLGDDPTMILSTYAHVYEEENQKMVSSLETLDSTNLVP